jgi:tetratricopeptide (TPR) repeat protein
VRQTLPRVLIVCVVLASATASPAGRPVQATPVTAHLDRFLRGEFDAVVAGLEATRDYDALLNALEQNGAAWVAAAPEPERSRRRLAAATFALEAGRAAALRHDWKWVQRIDLNQPWARPPAEIPIAERPPQTFRAFPQVLWKTAPRLIEWGCALVRTERTPDAAERIWHLAAVAVAQGVGDYEFLAGSPFEDRGNAHEEIEHLRHALDRFPMEPRLALAEAIAVEWYTWNTWQTKRPRQQARELQKAIDAFRGMLRDGAIGAEAMVRTGYLRLRNRQTRDALDLFARAETATRDPFVVYLARYFRGVAHERAGQADDAEKAYRSALEVVPHAQSAAFALAARLHTTGRPAAAARLVEETLAVAPPVADPWREYGAADARFWPLLRARLRAAIAVDGLEGQSR